MSNYAPGYYWVIQRGKSSKPVIARLMKNGHWEYMVSVHSNKLIGNKPYEVLSRIEDYQSKVYTDADLLKDLQSIHGKEEGKREFDMIKEMESKYENRRIV